MGKIKEFLEDITEKRYDPKKRREFYALTLVLVPTVLMGIISMSLDSFLERTVGQILILFLQGIVIRGIIENK
jgi:hypothetical protein